MKVTKKKFEFEVGSHERFDWFWKIFNDGTWEPSTFEIFDKYLKSDRPYFDIGAWIGPTALYGAKLAQQCFAFEPDLAAFQELTANINRNKVENICAYNAAIGGDWENIDLGPRNNFGDSMSSVLWKAGAVKVPCIPLDTIGREINPNFIKMDIEGMEDRALRGAKKTFSRHKPTCIIEIHKTDQNAVIDFLKAFGYAGFLTRNGDLFAFEREYDLNLEGFQKVFFQKVF